MTTAESFAPAKINLTLHVTGRRSDGYHELDSLVVFGDVGDRVEARPADRLSLEIGGPFADALETRNDNLVLRAARWLAPGRGARMTLIKSLPVASGLGGGSADCAAALRALCDLWGLALPDPASAAVLGADVPACLVSRALRMRGIGEGLELVPDLPTLSLVLVNPGVAVETPRVFAELATRTNPGMPDPPPFRDAAALAGWLAGQRNDLEAPAIAIAPVIGQALDALRATGCRLARMSGSGATVFGLFDRPQAAEEAAERLLRQNPGWWVIATQT